MNLLEPLRELARRTPEAVALWHPSTGAMTFAEFVARLDLTTTVLTRRHPTLSTPGEWVELPFPQLPQDYLDILVLSSLGCSIAFAPLAQRRLRGVEQEFAFSPPNSGELTYIPAAHLTDWATSLTALALRGPVATDLPLLVLYCLLKGIPVVLPRKYSEHFELQWPDQWRVSTLITSASQISQIFSLTQDALKELQHIVLLGYPDTKEGLALKDLLPALPITLLRADVARGPYAVSSLAQALAFSQRHHEPQLSLLGDLLPGCSISEGVSHSLIRKSGSSPLDSYIKVDGSWVYRTSANPLEFRIQSLFDTGKIFIHKLSSGKFIAIGNLPSDAASKIPSSIAEVSGIYRAKLRFLPSFGDVINRRESIRPSRSLIRWTLFLKERCALTQVLALAAAAALVSSVVYKVTSLSSLLLFLTFAMTLMLAIVLKEQSAYVRDCVVNPCRPLPRGLLSMSEVIAMIWSLRFAILSMLIGFISVLGFIKTAILAIVLMMCLECSYRFSFGRVSDVKSN